MLEPYAYKYLLASASPRRAALLDELGLSYRVVASDIEEEVREDIGLDEVASDIASQKGLAVKSQLHPGERLIAADTIVLHRGVLLGKPRHADEARWMLQQLSGDQHEVITGVFLSDELSSFTFSVRTIVHMRPITATWIDYYIGRQPPMDKAGGYGIQDWIGWAAIDRIEGSYSNVMGLPTSKLFDKLHHWS